MKFMFKQYREIQENEQFIVAVDTATGANDYTAVVYLSHNRMDVPIIYHSKETTSSFLLPLSRTLEKIYDITRKRPIIALERNNGGNFLMDRLSQMNLLGKFDLFKMPVVGSGDISDTQQLGWNTNTSTRPQMLSDLKEAIDNKLLGIYSQEIVNEMYSFVKVQTNIAWKAQAERNKNDDLIMALAIVLQISHSSHLKLHEEIPLTFKNDFSKWALD